MSVFKHVTYLLEFRYGESREIGLLGDEKKKNDKRNIKKVNALHIYIRRLHILTFLSIKTQKINLHNIHNIVISSIYCFSQKHRHMC